jgi:hypothetical protein
MDSKRALQTALCDLADELAGAHRSQDGFALLKEPIGVRTRLEPDFPDAPWESVGDLEGLCGLKGDRLIYLLWEGLGTSSVLIYEVVQLPSGRQLYLMYSDNEYGPTIMSVSKKKWTPRMDLKFLQYLFRNNSEAIGANMGSVPSEISTFLPFSFLIDLFITYLDTTDDGHAWTQLLDNYNDENKLWWNEEYENPRDPRPAEDISSPTLRARAEYRKSLNKAANHMRLHSDYNQKRPDDPDTRKRIVARFLAQALKAGMRWRSPTKTKKVGVGAKAPAAQ